jgi:hypothetical protein
MENTLIRIEPQVEIPSEQPNKAFITSHTRIC